ncbi:hypothetical protein AA13594_3197 [Gluconacetobacter azotocaptans DSM 13594]|nr:hypothetical protein AA13594_3197 [Gluconacetobacter azotocaptans DSM 13594]
MGFFQRVQGRGGMRRRRGQQGGEGEEEAAASARQDGFHIADDMGAGCGWQRAPPVLQGACGMHMSSLPGKGWRVT